MVERQANPHQNIQVPGAPDLPGLSFRRFHGAADYPLMLAVLEGSKQVDQLDERSSLEQIENQYAHLVNCDPYQDMLFAEVEGVTVAYCRVFWVQELRGDWVYVHLGNSLPAWRRKGIGGAMLRWCESRLRQIAAAHPQGASRLLQGFAADTEVGKLALYRRAGYRPARYFVEMTRDLGEPIPELELPAGLEVRPASPEHFRAIWEANIEAFQDHWGHRRTSESDYQRWRNDPHFDPQHWKVAWDGDQVAGMVLNFIDREENQEFQRKRGYTEDICVRRPWRRRGLARALIAESMRYLRDIGMEQAALGADTKNLTGAFKLYTGLGYQEVKRWSAYRKALD